MNISFEIDENDYLTYQLFVASKSVRIKKRRLRNKLIVPLIYGAFGVMLLFRGTVSIAISFFIFGLLWFFIYPLWERRRYIKHYQVFIRENYKDRLGKMVTLEFNNDFIFAKDSGRESRVLTTELEEICEIPTAVFVRLKGGQAFLLPKDKIENMETVITNLKELATHLDIKYELHEKWEWK